MPQIVLVAGGTSYVGSHVAVALRERGHRVVILDQGAEADCPAVANGIEVFHDRPGDDNALREVFRGHRFDGVVYIPAGDPCGRGDRGFGTIVDRVSPALALIRAAVDHNVRRFVLSTGGAIFSQPCRLPIFEDEEIETATVAGEAQRLIEGLLERARALHDLGWTCLRYVVPAGVHPGRLPGVRRAPESHLIPTALAVAEGARIYVDIPGTTYPTADGTYVRDYVHVCDLADAHVRAFEAIESAGRRYNVGLDRGHSVHEILGAVRRLTGAKIPSRAAAAIAAEPPAIVLTSARIRSELGWFPRYPDLDAIIHAAWEARDRRPRRAIPSAAVA